MGTSGDKRACDRFSIASERPACQPKKANSKANLNGLFEQLFAQNQSFYSRFQNKLAISRKKTKKALTGYKGGNKIGTVEPK